MAISADGQVIATQQCEYTVMRPQPGWAELDSRAVWETIKPVLRAVIARTKHDPITALCVDSMGEAMTPVSAGRDILGNSILGFDERGADTVARMQQLDPVALLRRSGNVASNLMGGPKLIWLRDHQPELFEKTFKFLNWADLVAYLLGGDPVTDLALANRSLFLDIQRATWSDETLAYVGMPPEKLPGVAQAGMVIGIVSSAMQDELGLPPGVKIVLGTHDQLATATGAGVYKPGWAVYGIGTFICITPTYRSFPPAEPLAAIGLGVEHHALPDLFVSLYYNVTGGALLRWFRDTFAAAEHAAAQVRGQDVYDLLLAEMPQDPSSLLVLPHFATTGPPYHDDRPYGMIAGLNLGTTRGDVVKALLEGVTYYFRQGMELLAAAQIPIDTFHVVGGGAKSDRWLQIKASILGKPLARLHITEAGVLGSAILAGLGSGVYQSVDEVMDRVIQVDRVFEPDLRAKARYDEQYARYQLLYPAAKAMRDLQLWSSG
jgi:xylulokinase